MKTFIQNNKRKLRLILSAVLVVCTFCGFMLTASAFTLSTTYTVNYSKNDATEVTYISAELTDSLLDTLTVSGVGTTHGITLNGDYYGNANTSTTLTVNDLTVSSVCEDEPYDYDCDICVFLLYKEVGDTTWKAYDCDVTAGTVSGVKTISASPLRIKTPGTYVFCTVKYRQRMDGVDEEFMSRSAYLTVNYESATDANNYVFEPDQNQSGIPNSWEAPSQYLSIREVTFLSDNTFKCVFDTQDIPLGYVTAYMWFATDDMVDVPVDGMSTQTAALLNNVVSMVMEESNERYTFYITLDELSTLDADVPTEVHFAICREPSQETFLWEMHNSIGTITRTELTRYPLPVEPTKEGYRFTGWYLDEACTQLYTEDYVTEDIVLYAGFEPIKTYITFNANGGQGSMDTLETIWGKTTNLPGCRFERAGYKFLGWATSANGPVVYKDNTDITTTENVGDAMTLYAVWEQISYKVTFIVDGEVYAVVTVAPGTSTEEVIASAVNSALYNVDDEESLPLE